MFLRFWNWAKKTVILSKFVAAQKMLIKQKPSSPFIKWIARFITLGIALRWKRVCIMQ